MENKIMPKRPTKTELRKALDAFIPPEANVEWADDWKPPTDASLPKNANAPAARRRARRTLDDSQDVDDKRRGANAVGRRRTQHPSEGRE